MKDYSEKRDFHRMQVNSTLQIIRNSGEVISGVCKDLSATGMQIAVGSPFEPGEELRTRMESAGSQFPPLETLCEVVRCQPEAEGYLIGVNITEVTQ